MSSNYPPGVNGSEPKITGIDPFGEAFLELWDSVQEWRKTGKPNYGRLHTAHDVARIQLDIADDE